MPEIGTGAERFSVRMPEIVTGAERLSVLPIPSWPYPFAPQHRTEPPLSSAQVYSLSKNPPATTVTALVMSEITTGTALLKIV